MTDKAGSGAPGSTSGKKQQVKTPPFNDPRGGGSTFPGSGAPILSIPVKSKVEVTKGDDGSLSITIPAAGLLARNGGTPPVYTLLFGICWIILVTIMPVVIIAIDTPPIFAFVAVPFYVFGILLILLSLRNANMEESLYFHAGQFALVKNWWGWKGEVRGSCKEIIFVDLKGIRTYTAYGPLAVESEPATWCVLVSSGKERKFGSFISFAEQQYLVGEIAQYLRVPMGVGAKLPSPRGISPKNPWEVSVP